MEDAILSVKCTLVLHLAWATCDREYVTLSNLPYEREREWWKKQNKNPKHNNKTKIQFFAFVLFFALDLSGIINQSFNQISIASNKSIDEVKYGYW